MYQAVQQTAVSIGSLFVFLVQVVVASCDAAACCLQSPGHKEPYHTQHARSWQQHPQPGGCTPHMTRRRQMRKKKSSLSIWRLVLAILASHVRTVKITPKAGSGKRFYTNFTLLFLFVLRSAFVFDQPLPPQQYRFIMLGIEWVAYFGSQNLKMPYDRPFTIPCGNSSTVPSACVCIRDEPTGLDRWMMHRVGCFLVLGVRGGVYMLTYSHPASPYHTLSGRFVCLFFLLLFRYVVFFNFQFLLDFACTMYHSAPKYKHILYITIK